MAGNLWKPVSEKGQLVILFDKKPGKVVIRDAETGKVIETGVNHGPSNDRADTVRFSKPGGQYNNVIVETENGGSFQVGNGSSRYDGFSIGTRENPSKLGGGTSGGGEGVGGFGAGVPGVASPVAIDPSLVETFPIEARPVGFREIETAPFEFTDPLESTARTGAFNRRQQIRNFITGTTQARILQQLDLLAIQDFAEQMSGTQKELLTAENAFNQQQRLKAAEAAIPGIQSILGDQRERGETLASGRLLATAEDRAIELAARSASADGSFVRGFGDDSVVGRRASDILSARQRLEISQIGENLLSSSVNQAANILMDQPLKANISQRLPSTPPVNVSQISQAQQGQLNALTTISPGTALQAEIGQEQFETNIEQRTREFNTTGVFTSDRFNSTQEFAAQEFNSRQSFEGMLTKLGIITSNAFAEQAFQQSQFDAAAGGEQVAIEQTEREKQQEKLDKLIADYEKNRDRDQLTKGVATLLGLGLGDPKVREAVSDIISGGVDLVTDLFGDDEEGIAGDDQVSTPTDGGGEDGFVPDDDIDNGRPAPDWGDDAISVQPGEEAPEGFVGIGTDEDGSEIYVPEEDYRRLYSSDLVGVNGRTRSFITPSSPTYQEFDSGADLSVPKSFRFDLGDML